MFRKSSLTLLVILFPCSILFAQGGWFWQNPLPQGNTLLDVKMLDANTIGAVGGVGTFMKSSDSGNNWDVNHKINGIDFSFDALFFLNASTGWAPAGGSIYKTTDGGASWNSYETGSFSNFEDIFFTNENSGWVVGNAGTVYNTTDGGMTWNPQTTGTTRTLYSVVFTNATTGCIVGSFGTIFTTTNGGTNWDPITTGTNTTFESVYFIDQLNGWAAGGQNGQGAIYKTTD